MTLSGEREEGQGGKHHRSALKSKEGWQHLPGNPCIRAALQKCPVSPRDGPDLVSLLHSVTGRKQPAGSTTSEQMWLWILGGNCWSPRSVKLPIVGGLWVHSHGCHGD